MPDTEHVVIETDALISRELLLIAAKNGADRPDDRVARLELVPTREQVPHIVHTVECIRTLGNEELDALIADRLKVLGEELVQQPIEARVVSILAPDFLRVAAVVTGDAGHEDGAIGFGEQREASDQPPAQREDRRHRVELIGG